MIFCFSYNKNRAKVQHYKKRARTVLHLFNNLAAYTKTVPDIC